MNKLIRDGKVAVLYSPGYGAGWWSWNTEHTDMMFDPGMAGLVEKGDLEQMRVYAELKWPDAYLGGLENLDIEWLPEGTRFIIDETDGFESVMVRDEIHWRIA